MMDKKIATCTRKHMNKTIVLIIGSLTLLVASFVHAATEVVDGYTWVYSVSDGVATIESGITPELTGHVTIPSTLGGYPVKRIGTGAFIDKFYNVKRITIPYGVEFLGEKAFWNNAIDDDASKIIDIPSSVVKIHGWGVFKFSGATLHWNVSPKGVEFINGYGGDPFWFYRGKIELRTACSVVPQGFPVGSCKSVQCYRAAGRNWIDAVGMEKFIGFVDDEVTAEVLTCKMRANNPVIMDVTYRIASDLENINVRALAYQGGVKSFANVIRPTSFVEGTGAFVGDGVSANEVHTLSWNTSGDLNSGMSDISFEVFAAADTPLPLELTTIPATSSHAAITYSWNAQSDDRILQALYWYYASGVTDLVLESGNLKYGSITLASGERLSNAAKAAEYVLGKMGYSILSGSELSYVNSVSGLSLTPSGSRQYAVKYP